MPAYTVNEDAVKHAKRLIDARQYVLRSRWQDVQPRAREQNAFLKTHPWEEYAAWHLGLTEGAPEGAPEQKKARYAFVYGDFRRLHRMGLDRLPLPCRGVAAQGDRARSTRAPAVPRPKDRLTTPRASAPLGEASGFVASTWLQRGGLDSLVGLYRRASALDIPLRPSSIARQGAPAWKGWPALNRNGR
jgi:hypothetical protein